VRDAAEVQSNWDEIKAFEGGSGSRRSVVEGIPTVQPALSLTAKLQSRATKAGLPVDLVVPSLAAADNPAAAVSAVAAELLDADVPPAVSRVGELLFSVVLLARTVGADPEAALRGTALEYRSRLAEIELGTVDEADGSLRG
jgi:uncharacterized protein YabN with tetrapyrrole methylase and pyrophosphatase domain